MPSYDSIKITYMKIINKTKSYIKDIGNQVEISWVFRIYMSTC